MSTANLLLRTSGDEDDPERALHELQAELATFDRQEAGAEANVDTTRARADLTELRRRLEAIDRMNASADVSVRVAGALASLRAFEAYLNRVDAMRATATVDVKVNRELVNGQASPYPPSCSEAIHRTSSRASPCGRRRRPR